MSDGPYEKKFCKWINSIGGKHFKGPAMVVKGIPDRIAFLPNLGGTVYVEFKESEARDLEPMQKWWRNVLLHSDPNRYFVVDNEESLEYTINRCKSLIKIGKIMYTQSKNLLLSLGEESFSDLRKSNKFSITSTDCDTYFCFDYNSLDSCIDPNNTTFYVRINLPKIPDNPEELEGTLVLLDDLVYVIRVVDRVGSTVRCGIRIYYQYDGQATASPFKYIN